MLNLAARHISTQSAGAVHDDDHLSLGSHEHEPARPQCGTHEKIGDDYNMKIHVIALFIMLLTSTLASCGPLYVRRIIEKQFELADSNPSYETEDKLISKNDLKTKLINWFQWLLWVARHFGTGVIIGTAFIHLLPGAHAFLTDPCLPEFWTDTYASMPEAIAMVGAFVMFVVDFFSKRWIEHLQKRALEKDGAVIAVAAGRLRLCFGCCLGGIGG